MYNFEETDFSGLAFLEVTLNLEYMRCGYFEVGNNKGKIRINGR